MICVIIIRKVLKNGRCFDKCVVQCLSEFCTHGRLQIYTGIYLKKKTQQTTSIFEQNQISRMKAKASYILETCQYHLNI